MKRRCGELGRLLTRSPRPPPSYMDAVTKNDARAATAGPCCSCQQDSPYNSSRRSWRTWNEQVGAKQNERGQTDEKGSGHGMAKVAGKQTKPAEQGRCRRTQPADDLTGTGLEATQQPAVGRPRSKTTAADDVGRPLAVQCRLVEGVRWCRPLKGRAQTYLTCLPPTYRLCLSLSLPIPLI